MASTLLFDLKLLVVFLSKLNSQCTMHIWILLKVKLLYKYIVVYLRSVRFIADIAKNVPHGNEHFVAPIKSTNLEAFFTA